MPEQRDFVLTPVQYAYVQDGTSGKVRVWVGPLANPLNQNDRLVTWTGTKFHELKEDEYAQAKIGFTTATENQYIVLENPARGNTNSHPPKGTTGDFDLDVGKRIVIPGPTTFPLWPGQRGRVIDGHRLAFNEYLNVQCYDPEAANASEAIVAPAEGKEKETATKAAAEKSWTIGERRVIKGTRTSFYIPPTGVEVLRQDADKIGKDEDLYARKAAVIRQLEYVCLENEKGQQRYEEGPDVIFPEPDEEFVYEHGERVYRKLDLNAISGLHIKVNQDYVHDGDAAWEALRGAEKVTVKPGEKFREGDELFITGKHVAIYMPRTEHGVIEYGDYKRKHNGIALPAGEGRYFLDRMGDKGVQRVLGPKVFLPDPRTEVIVRRVLDQKTVDLWYPGNKEAQQINLQLEQEQASQGDQYLTTEPLNYAVSAAVGQAGSLAKSSSKVVGGMAANRIKRGTEYTPTRTITLDTKYAGIPRLSVYPGYAVMVMDPTGKREVKEGPVDLLPEYHETLMALTLSTGRPKGSGSPIRTVYLRTLNNAVGDKTTVETRDLVPVSLELSLRVNFEGETPEERNRWFYVEDYVALLTDHVRSRLRNLVKRHSVQEFMGNTADLIRDELLGVAKEGETRPGLSFPENGMRLYDVEVLSSEVETPQVRGMLETAAARSVEQSVKLTQAKEETDNLKLLEAYSRQQIDEREETAERRSSASVAEVERGSVLDLRVIAADLQSQEDQALVAAAMRQEKQLDADQTLAIRRSEDERVLDRAKSEAELFISRAQAIDPKIAEAINRFGQEKITAEIATALAGQSLLMGTSVSEVLAQRLKGTALEPVFAELASPAWGNGDAAE